MAETGRSVALITGGSQGIGKAMALEFGKAGYSLAICARTKEDVDRAASELCGMGMDCAGFPLDVRDHKAVGETVARVSEKFGRIDVLVTCAGVYGPIGPLEENDGDEWEQAIRINLCGTAFAVRAVLPIMKKQGKGCIVSMAGGGTGSRNIKPNLSSYITAKFAICGFVEVLSSELAGTGVRINAISPGAVNTRLLDQVLASGERAGKKFYHDSLIQKETGGTPRELAAKFARYLASDEAAHISGKVLSVVWDRPEMLSGMKNMGNSIFTLRRIDGVLFKESDEKK
ncbi:MAG: SDR family oxidoreductase [Candidatus Micrarchaeia archaeon]|jgi:3-oxoacyl-[acyl-carrier protein] reductase